MTSIEPNRPESCRVLKECMLCETKHAPLITMSPDGRPNECAKLPTGNNLSTRCSSKKDMHPIGQHSL